MDISPPKKVVYLKPLTLKCNASIIQSRLAEQLMQYAKLEWLNPVGEVMSNNNNPMIEEENVQNNLTSTIHLKSVFFRHKGKYICRSIFDFPGEGIVKYNQTSTTIDVIGKNMIVHLRGVTTNNEPATQEFTYHCGMNCNSCVNV